MKFLILLLLVNCSTAKVGECYYHRGEVIKVTKEDNIDLIDICSGYCTAGQSTEYLYQKTECRP